MKKVILATMSILILMAGAVFILTYGILYMPVLHSKLIRERVGPKVVLLYNKDISNSPDMDSSGGTGFHIQAANGKVYIMTNRHICDLADKTGTLWAQSVNGVIYPVKVLKKSQDADLCVMTPLRGFEGLPIAESTVPNGEVIAVGHPDLQPLTITKGELIAPYTVKIRHRIFAKKNNTAERQCLRYPTDRIVREGSYVFCVSFLPGIITTASIYFGSSGSPAVNNNGEVIGVFFAIRGNRAISCIVPLKYVKQLLKEVE